MLGLSVALVRVKTDRARVQAEIRSGIYEFVQGTPLPGVQVRDSTGRFSPLTDICDGHTPVVVMITQEHCEACEQIAPLWHALASHRRDSRFVLIYTYGVPARELAAPYSNVSLRSTLPGLLGTIAHIHAAPAAIAVDKQCHIIAAGSGPSASRAVLEQLPAPDVH